MAVLALMLGASAFAAAPALAGISSSGLAHTAGHTCKSILSVKESNGTDTAGFCIELGIYTSLSTGQSSVVAQIEAICEVPENNYVACDRAVGEAAPYTPNYQGTEELASDFDCISTCVAPRTYIFPLATTNSTINQDLYIYPGSCVNNVWAVLWAGSYIDNSDPGHYSASLSGNLGTPHYNVCMSSSGGITWTELS